MVPAAPRIHRLLVDRVDQLSRQPLGIAEIGRRVGATAETLGLPRPSYEQIRVLAHAARLQARTPTAGEVLVDIAFRARPPTALADHLADPDGTPRIRRK
jgi:hypothetical protein